MIARVSSGRGWSRASNLLQQLKCRLNIPLPHLRRGSEPIVIIPVHTYLQLEVLSLHSKANEQGTRNAAARVRHFYDMHTAFLNLSPGSVM